MTKKELIAKVIEHARAQGITVERLTNPCVRSTAMIRFESTHTSSTAEFLLDRKSGEFITARFSGPEFIPKPKGKQLSKAAQAVLARASSESKRLKYDHVGSEHLLAGVLAYGKGIGPNALLEAGLSLDKLRQRLAAVGKASRHGSSGYDQSMRGVLRASCQHADSLGDDKIRPEHLVLGLLDEAVGGTFDALKHFGVNVKRIRKHLFQRIAGERN